MIFICDICYKPLTRAILAWWWKGKKMVFVHRLRNGICSTYLREPESFPICVTFT